MKIAYFDCFSGASGDMILGAMLSCGLDIEVLKRELSGLQVPGYELSSAGVIKSSLRAIQANVIIDKAYEVPSRTLSAIIDLIEQSALDELVKTKAIKIFKRLGEAEAFVHGVELEKVHFHEVGAIDSIVDIVGSVIGLNLLGIDRIMCSPINVGGGFVKTSHGVLPSPAPATLELMKGLPTYSTGMHGELLTPTGAAILSTLASDFGPMPDFRIMSVGYGSGKSDFDFPNVVRLVIGESPEINEIQYSEPVAVMETNIDDMSPQIYDHVFDKALKNGALDICLTTMQMKKNRPGIQLQIICPVSHLSSMAELIFGETTSIGLRWRIENRIVANRTIESIETEYGKSRVKVAYWNGEVVNVAAEYEDCKKLAAATNVSIKQVMMAVSLKASQIFGRRRKNEN